MSEQIKIGDILVHIERKKVRNLNLRVSSPDGSIKVSVPYGMSKEKALAFISSKEDWIKKQQVKILANSFNSIPEYIGGEEHYLFGQLYPLDIRDTTKKEGVVFENNRIILYCKPGSGREEKERLMDNWYRENLLRNLPGLICKWEEIMGLKVKEFRIRKMTTRWGTCNPKARRIWFSLMLAKRRPALIEYIVVHEMTHFRETGHNKRFYGIMDSYLPGWKELRKELR